MLTHRNLSYHDSYFGECNSVNTPRRTRISNFAISYSNQRQRCVNSTFHAREDVYNKWQCVNVQLGSFSSNCENEIRYFRAKRWRSLSPTGETRIRGSTDRTRPYRRLFVKGYTTSFLSTILNLRPVHTCNFLL